MTYLETPIPFSPTEKASVGLPKRGVEVPDGANTQLELILGILRDKCVMPQMPWPIKVSPPEAEL